MRVRPLFLIAWSIWLTDFLTKFWAERNLVEPIKLIGDFLKLQLSTNSGAAFSLRISSIILTIFAIVTSAVIVYWSPRITSKAWAITFGLVLGGALGNLTDRITKGEVTDWISIKYWPTFNIADSAIVVAAAIAIYLTARNVPPVPRFRA